MGYFLGFLIGAVLILVPAYLQIFAGLGMGYLIGFYIVVVIVIVAVVVDIVFPPPPPPPEEGNGGGGDSG